MHLSKLETVVILTSALSVGDFLDFLNICAVIRKNNWINATKKERFGCLNSAYIQIL